jgi:hypothetical protein
MIPFSEAVLRHYCIQNSQVGDTHVRCTIANKFDEIEEEHSEETSIAMIEVSQNAF